MKLGLESRGVSHLPAQLPATVIEGAACPEEIGVIADIGRLILRMACREALRWQQAGSPVSVAVNVSPVEFAGQDFIESVVDALSETGLDPARLATFRQVEKRLVLVAKWAYVSAASETTHPLRRAWAAAVPGGRARVVLR